MFQAFPHAFACTLGGAGQGFGHEAAEVVAFGGGQGAVCGDVLFCAQGGEGLVVIGVHIDIGPAVDELGEIRGIAAYAGGVHGARAGEGGEGFCHGRGGYAETEVEQGIGLGVENFDDFR